MIGSRAHFSSDVAQVISPGLVLDIVLTGKIFWIDRTKSRFAPTHYMNERGGGGDGFSGKRVGENADTLAEQWLKAMAMGDQRAFAALYQEFAPRLYGYLRVQINHDADIQDLMQDIFVAIWKSSARYNGEAKVATWIFAIARHKLLDWLRSRRRYSQLESLEEIGEFRSGSEPDIADQVVTELSVADALAALPPHHAELFYLVFVEGMSYKEISVLLGIPEGTVKSRMHQAKGRMRQQLRKGGTDDERTV